MRLGIPELIVLLFMVLPLFLMVAWPASRIMRRLGFPPLLGVLSIVPLANLALLWIVAFIDWPGRPDKQP